MSRQFQQKNKDLVNLDIVASNNIWKKKIINIFQTLKIMISMEKSKKVYPLLQFKPIKWAKDQNLLKTLANCQKLQKTKLLTILITKTKKLFIWLKRKINNLKKLGMQSCLVFSFYSSWSIISFFIILILLISELFNL